VPNRFYPDFDFDFDFDLEGEWTMYLIGGEDGA